MSHSSDDGFQFTADPDEGVIYVKSKSEELSDKISALGSPEASVRATKQHLACNINNPGIRKKELYYVRTGTFEPIPNVAELTRMAQGEAEPVLKLTLHEIGR